MEKNIPINSLQAVPHWILTYKDQGFVRLILRRDKYTENVAHFLWFWLGSLFNIYQFKLKKHI